MSLELTGRLVKVLPEQSGSGKNGPWLKQDFVIETPGEYPRKVCISAWGDKANELKSLSPEDMVKVNVNIESREYNEKWYTDVRAWKIEKEGGGQPGNSVAPPEFSENDIPPEDESDDLPF